MYLRPRECSRCQERVRKREKEDLLLGTTKLFTKINHNKDECYKRQLKFIEVNPRRCRRHLKTVEIIKKNMSHIEVIKNDLKCQ